MLKAPCKDCTERYLGCHDHCEKYKEFDVVRKRLNEEKLVRQQTNYDLFKVRKHHIRKDRRR